MAEIEFVGYAGDCIVTGSFDVPPEQRLTDALNATEEFAIGNGILVSHLDGHIVEVPGLVLDRHDVFAVEGRGAAGTWSAASAPVPVAWSCPSGRTSSAARSSSVRVLTHWPPSTIPA